MKVELRGHEPLTPCMPSTSSVTLVVRRHPRTVAVPRILSINVRRCPPKLGPDGAHYGAPRSRELLPLSPFAGGGEHQSPDASRSPAVGSSEGRGASPLLRSSGRGVEVPRQETRQRRRRAVRA